MFTYFVKSKWFGKKNILKHLMGIMSLRTGFFNEIIIRAVEIG